MPGENPKKKADQVAEAPADAASESDQEPSMENSSPQGWSPPADAAQTSAANLGETLAEVAKAIRDLPARGAMVAQDQPGPTSLKALSDTCTGQLCITLFAYPCATDDGRRKSDYPVVPGVEVRVTGPEDYSECGTSDQNGEICLSGLASGDYSFAVEAPAHYELPQNIYYGEQGQSGSTERTLDGSSVSVGDNSSVWVEIGLLPDPATVSGTILYNADPRGGSAPQPINNVRVDFYRDGERFECATTQSNDNDVDGTFSLPVKCMGVIEVAPPDTITLNDGTIARLTQKARTSLYLAPGGQNTLSFSYAPGLAQVVVGARFAQHEHTNPKDMSVLPGVAYTIYPGNDTTSAPIATIRSGPGGTVTFPDLDPGPYVITADPPATYHGHALQLVSPANGIFQVQPGNQLQPFPSAFTFRAAVGSIVGSVFDDSQNGLAGVTVVLTRLDGRGTPSFAQTGGDGEYTFPNVAPGSYLVSLGQDTIGVDGVAYVASASSPTQQPVTVKASAIATGPTFLLEEDVHEVYGDVVGTDGQPLAFAVIEILDAGGRIVASATADENGSFSQPVPRAATYRLRVRETSAGVPVQEIPVAVNSRRYVRVQVRAAGGGAGSFVGGAGAPPAVSPPPAANGNARAAAAVESMTDLQAYPLLTENVGYPMAAPAPAPTVPGGGGGTGAPLGQIVDSALRDVLSWRPKAGDAKGFVNALNQAFTLRDDEGHTTWTWTPKSYTVQTDLGAVTGAQASIYTRAKVALDQSMPLLNGLYTLRADVLPEDLESIRGVVADLFARLVDEFGVEGGPRVQRVNELFQLLLGPTPVSDPEKLPPGVILWTLGDRFGMSRSTVNTVEDEQDLTNFLILVDYINGLYQSWQNQVNYFVPNPPPGSGVQPFLGTQLVLLSQAFEVVAQSVQDLYFAMDSVFLGQAERQTILLTFGWQQYASTPGAFSQMYAGDLFDWVYGVASDEGPRVVQSAGKDGIVAFQPILQDLATYVQGALIMDAPYGGQQITRSITSLVPGWSGPPVPQVPPGYSTPRVQRALQELADQLDDAHTLASQILPAQLDPGTSGGATAGMTPRRQRHS